MGSCTLPRSGLISAPDDEKNGKECEVEIKHPNKEKICIKLCGPGPLRLPFDTWFGLLSQISWNKRCSKLHRASSDAASNPAAAAWLIKAILPNLYRSSQLLRPGRFGDLLTGLELHSRGRQRAFNELEARLQGKGGRLIPAR